MKETRVYTLTKITHAYSFSSLAEMVNFLDRNKAFHPNEFICERTVYNPDWTIVVYQTHENGRWVFTNGNCGEKTSIENAAFIHNSKKGYIPLAKYFKPDGTTDDAAFEKDFGVISGTIEAYVGYAIEEICDTKELN